MSILTMNLTITKELKYWGRKFAFVTNCLLKTAIQVHWFINSWIKCLLNYPPGESFSTLLTVIKYINYHWYRLHDMLEAFHPIVASLTTPTDWVMSLIITWIRCMLLQTCGTDRTPQKELEIWSPLFQQLAIIEWSR